MMKRDQVARLIAFENLSHREVAEKLGISKRWVGTLWREAKAAAFADAQPPQDLREEIRINAETRLRELIEVGLRKYPRAASYGAVVVQSLRTLLEMHGALLPLLEGAGKAEKSLEEVAASVRAKSPLLLARLGVISRLRGNGPSPGATD